MARDYNDYRRQLQALLPKGRLWRSDDTVKRELFNGMGTELARVDNRMVDLLNERDVRTTTELIAEHEYELGLPDGDLETSGLTLAERRAQLLMKLRALGGLDPQYYIGLAAALGYTITIDQFTPAWCGLVVCGAPCGDQDIIFKWLVNVHYDFANPFTDYDDLEYLLKQLKPVHTSIFFRIYGPGFDNGFSNGFNAMPAADLTKGGFSTGFDKGFDVFYGGGFDASGFSDGFDKPYVKFGY